MKQSLVLASIILASISLAGCGATIGLGPAEVSLESEADVDGVANFGVYSPYYVGHRGGGDFHNGGFHSGGHGRR
jgi:hypothetical protein